MATIRFLGQAPGVAQIATVQVTAYDAATTYKLTINGKVVSVIAQGSVNLTASGLSTAWNALSTTQYPEHSEVTASVATDTVTLTADVAGRPFTCTSSVSGGAGTIGAVTTTTANAGPNDWSSTNNWSGGAIPVGADIVYIDNSAVPILYGFAQSAVTLAELHIPANYTGQIGLPKRNQGGYSEYRDDYLAISATILKIGAGPGAGSGRLKINTGTNATTLDVERTAPTLEPGVPSFCWKGVHASNAVNITRGHVGISFFGLDAATLPTLRVGYVTSVDNDANVVCGAGTTLTTVNQLGGRLEVNSNTVTANVRGGELTLKGAATLTTLDLGVLDPRNLAKSRFYYNSSGTITTCNLRRNGTLDCSQDMRTRTITTLNQYAGSSIFDPNNGVTKAPVLSGGATPVEVGNVF